MRIIAGEKRGLLLQTPQDMSIRPTYDRVREAVFGRLQFDIRDACVLDLFAGTGALGIEALSRGARSAVFVDQSPAAIKIIRSNLEKAKFSDRAQVIFQDAFSALRQLTGHTRFDVVFIDPPYRDMLYAQTLDTLHECAVLADGATLVLESDEPTDLTHPAYGTVKTKKYGKTYITYLEYNHE